MFRLLNDLQNTAFASSETKNILEKYVKLLDVVKCQEEVLKNQYTEIPIILDEWQGCSRKLQLETAEKNRLKQENIALNADISTFRSEIENLKAKLRDAEANAALNKSEITMLNEELQQNQKKLKNIREIMQEHFSGFSEEVKGKLSFLRDSGVGLTDASRAQQMDEDTVDDLDYDESRGSSDVILLDTKRYSKIVPEPLKKNKEVPMVTEEYGLIPPKRYRSTHAVPPPSVLDFSISFEQSPCCNETKDRSNEQMTPVAVKNLMALNNQRNNDVAALKTPLRPIASSRWLRGSPIENRKHTFERLATKLKVTTCSVCLGAISIVGRPARRCKDCHQHVHMQCKQRLPVPCIPRIATPTKTPRKPGQAGRYKLQDFCPNSSPMIAWPIVHCVVELEKRGMNQEGLYTVSARSPTVTNLLNEFRTSRSIPKLENVELKVIADVVKRFLSELRDPLIPKTSRQEFISAVLNDKGAALNNAIFDLPQANRDTLAYLILHWQKIAANQQLNKMSIENIAKCVGLSVMGQNIGTDGRAATQVTRYCERVISSLLSINEEYWKGYLYSNLDTPQTPKSTISSSRSKIRKVRSSKFKKSTAISAANCSLLGPITPPSRGAHLIRQPVTPNVFFHDPCN